MTMNKYFENIRTLEELRKQYKELKEFGFKWASQKKNVVLA